MDNKRTRWIRTLLVGIVVFFGAGFTIMAYFNDVAIAVVFRQFYESLMGPGPHGLTEVELCYCIGVIFGTGGYVKHVM